MRHIFRLRGEIDPQTLPRIVGQLARLWIAPVRLEARREGDEFSITFETADLPDDKARVMAATLGSYVLVHEVELVAEPLTKPAGDQVAA